jgi:hypothetical protein
LLVLLTLLGALLTNLGRTLRIVGEVTFTATLFVGETPFLLRKNNRGPSCTFKFPRGILLRGLIYVNRLLVNEDHLGGRGRKRLSSLQTADPSSGNHDARVPARSANRWKNHALRALFGRPNPFSDDLHLS